MLRLRNIYVTTTLICTAVLITITSSTKKNLPSGECAQEVTRLLKLMKEGFQDIEMPLCDKDGTYKQIYYCMWTGSCFCVDRNGKHILARGWNIPPLKKGKCNMQRKRALRRIKAGVRNVKLPECMEGGDRYKAGIHCDKGKCYCVDEYGKKTVMF